ncbi:TerB family tellurite resistance protein [Chamaesiphon polymorphus]|uniref:Tellurite resistance protein TerB n=1 Tax=Chamaesiphon polymorphus CCALA 037 TaxID=2107692 RepID=A0A2T1FB92_9CYAN|nr:TerB family tellurite resistance protein [Chamaesiphon polymorphus]PSB42246.1 Tellurite resistance protein TerB [Chamaesiphon polymorphus CCALA 037]
MQAESQGRLLMKILIGVAWLDGTIQPEERQYLSKVVHDRQLDLEPEIESLLTGSSKVTPTDCEQWIGEYLGDRSIYDDDALIEAISGLIYSDGDVAMAEAHLLANIQSTPSSAPATAQPITVKIQQLYHNWVQKLR